MLEMIVTWKIFVLCHIKMAKKAEKKTLLIEKKLEKALKFESEKN